LTRVHDHNVLGLPLSVALKRLAEIGVYPSVTLSAAKSRDGSGGELRVVRQSADGGELVACAFQVQIREEK